MRRFLYFIPGAQGIGGAAELGRLGILSRFTSGPGRLVEHGITPIDNGPGGASGCIVAAGTMPPIMERVGEWVSGGVGEKSVSPSPPLPLAPSPFFVAIESEPPLPADLERALGISGYETTLGDSQTWRVPLLWRWKTEQGGHVPNLPTSLRPTFKDGRAACESRVTAAYEEANRIARWTWEAFVNERSISIDELFTAAVQALEVNYRIGPAEAGLLGLLDQHDALRVLNLAIDGPRLREAASKAAATGLVLSTGGEGASG